jgi:hypothetical protein
MYLFARARSRERYLSACDVLEGSIRLFMADGVLTVMEGKSKGEARKWMARNLYCGSHQDLRSRPRLVIGAKTRARKCWIAPEGDGRWWRVHSKCKVRCRVTRLAPLRLNDSSGRLYPSRPVCPSRQALL